MNWDQSVIQMLTEIGACVGAGIAAFFAVWAKSHAASANDAVNNRHPQSPKLRDEVSEIREAVREIQEDNRRTKQWLLNNCPLAEASCPLAAKPTKDEQT